MNEPRAEKSLVDYEKYFSLHSTHPEIKSTEDSTYEYFGFALPGTATNSPQWRIMRLKKGSDFQLKYPKFKGNNDAGFVHIWDDVLVLSYD